MTDGGHYANRRSADRAESCDFAESAHPQLQHERFDSIVCIEDRDGKTLIVVVRPLGERHAELRREDVRNHVLRRGLAHRSSDPHYAPFESGIKSFARPLTQLHQRDQRVVDHHCGASPLWLACGEIRTSTARHGVGDEVMAITCSNDRDEQLARDQRTRVERHS